MSYANVVLRRWAPALGLALVLLTGGLLGSASARVTGLNRASPPIVGFDSTSNKTITGSCTPNQRLLGLTGEVGFPGGEVVLDDVRPNSGLQDGLVRALEDENGFAGDWGLATYLMCADPPAGLERVSATGAFNSSNKNVSVSCPAGKRVLSAGGEVNAGSGQVVLDDIRPNAALTGVTVQGVEDETGNSGSWSVTAHAVCATAIEGLERVASTSALSSSDKSATATCPSGKQVVGAGWDTNAGNGQVVANDVFPAVGLTTVGVTAHEDENGYAGSWSVTSYAVCAPSTQRVSAASPLDSEVKTLTQTCPPGQQVLGTGYDINAGNGEVSLRGLTPFSNAFSGLAFVRVDALEDESGKSGVWSVTVYEICSNPPPGLQLVSETSATDSTNKGITATCPAGKDVLGGGGEVAAANGEVVLDDLTPAAFLNGVTGFTARGLEDQTGFAGDWWVTAYAICATPPPGLEQVSSTGPINSSNKSATATCPAGKTLLAAGGSIGPGDNGAGQVILDDIRPNAALTSVTAQGVEDGDGTTSNWNVQARAVCANF